MEQLPVRELNQHTSKVLARVRRGESFLVTDRGEPVARLVPVAGGLSSLARLVVEGRATAPDIVGPVPMPPALGDPGVDSAAELAASRDEERW